MHHVCPVLLKIGYDAQLPMFLVVCDIISLSPVCWRFIGDHDMRLGAPTCPKNNNNWIYRSSMNHNWYRSQKKQQNPYIFDHWSDQWSMNHFKISGTPTQQHYKNKMRGIWISQLCVSCYQCTIIHSQAADKVQCTNTPLGLKCDVTIKTFLPITWPLPLSLMLLIGLWLVNYSLLCLQWPMWCSVSPAADNRIR